MVFLKKMFGDSKETTLSGLMVERYDQHKKDLKLLKDTFSSYRKIYNKIFRSKKDIKDDKDMCLYTLDNCNYTGKYKDEDFSEIIIDLDDFLEEERKNLYKIKVLIKYDKRINNKTVEKQIQKIIY